LRLWIQTFGCKTNLADTAAIVDELAIDRWTIVRSIKQADLALVNTCTVTHKADRDARKVLNALQRKHPSLSVVVTGCLVSRNVLTQKDFPNVRALIPPGNPKAVARIINGGDKLTAFQNPQHVSAFKRLGRTRAFAKVQDGCNAYCTYCILPYVRGPERSLPLDQASRLITNFLRQGHCEVVLTGIHLGRYGCDLAPKSSLAKLLQRVAPGFGQEHQGCRLRLSSIEPMEWNKELLDTIERLEFICPHFHIPLQSGDDKVLRDMGRPYTAMEYENVIRSIHNRLPDAALGTDVLVGFPTESEKAARHTLELVDSLPLAYLHVFTYSRRQGTFAASLPYYVSSKIVRNRALQLRNVSQRHWQNFLQQGVGTLQRVLPEKHLPQGVIGRSEFYRPVLIHKLDIGFNQIVRVYATKLSGGILEGVMKNF
jgi:threonylcarbamoyladenosine tRNA methylthiotransferase MtaB